VRTRGFLNEIVQQLDQPATAAHLHRLIEEKFAANTESNWFSDFSRRSRELLRYLGHWNVFGVLLARVQWSKSVVELLKSYLT